MPIQKRGKKNKGGGGKKREKFGYRRGGLEEGGRDVQRSTRGADSDREEGDDQFRNRRGGKEDRGRKVNESSRRGQSKERIR